MKQGVLSPKDNKIKNDCMHINSTIQIKWTTSAENTNNHNSPNMKYLNNQINNLNSPITMKKI